MTNSAAVLNATTLSCSITCKNLDPSVRWYHEALSPAVDQTYEREGKVVGADASWPMLNE